LLICAALVCLPQTVFAGAEAPQLLADALASKRLAAEAIGNGRDQLTATLRNAAATPQPVTIPAGLIAGTAKGNRVIVTRAASVAVPAQGSLEVAVPVAAFSSGNPAASSAFELTTDSEPRLSALLRILADQPDAPKATVQLAVFAVLEDMTFAQWRKFLGSSEPEPTPAEITQAIDALGLLRLAEPDRTFALANDDDLKRRALRNPWSRAKAMAVYRLDLGDGAVPPDLRQLLHTAPGDNCPICRQRGLMQGRADAP
jgi:hypothetical protein